MSTDKQRPLKLEPGFLAGLYLLEAGMVSSVLSLYKYHDHLATLRPAQSLWLLLSLGLLGSSPVYLAWAFLRADPGETRSFGFTLATNLVVVMSLVAIGEMGVRIGATQSPLGPSFEGTFLLPRSWPRTVARNQSLLAGTPSLSYFVPDTLLGWTVGRSRTAFDGMYQSSTEGIRSRQAGTSLADSPIRRRVATVGDSYTFGLEGPYQDSWGAKLDSALTPDAIVLNFGVDGFGVDQAYLRYRRDVRPWHPAVTIFGFIHHDLSRTLSVYTFLSFPAWGFPFSKPRYHLTGDTLELMNTPVLSPERIIEVPAISDLPLLEYEPGYDPAEWQPHWYYRSYLLRYLLSRFPRYRPVSSTLDDQALRRLNIAILLDFARLARSDGTVPIVAYYPSRSSFAGTDMSAKDSVLGAVRRAGVTALDLTECIGVLGTERAFIPGKPHYSAAGNAAVAECLRPAVLEALAAAAAQAGAAVAPRAR